MTTKTWKTSRSNLWSGEVHGKSAEKVVAHTAARTLSGMIIAAKSVITPVPTTA